MNHADDHILSWLLTPNGQEMSPLWLVASGVAMCWIMWVAVRPEREVFNTRDNRDIRVRVTPAPEMGWVKVKQIP